MKSNEIRWHPRGVYFTFEQWAICATMFVAYSGFSIAMFVVLLSIGVPTHRSILFLVAVFPVGWILFRCAWAAVIVKTDCFVIRNVFRTRKVEMKELQSFSLKSRKRTVFLNSASARLRSGEEIMIFAIQESTRDQLAKGQLSQSAQLVEELNSVLRNSLRD